MEDHPSITEDHLILLEKFMKMNKLFLKEKIRSQTKMFSWGRNKPESKKVNESKKIYEIIVFSNEIWNINFLLRNSVVICLINWSIIWVNYKIYIHFLLIDILNFTNINLMTMFINIK